MDALRSDPFDMSAFDRLFQEAQRPVGRLHEEATTLRASAPALDVLALPTADQPPTFSGAVGRYTLQASLSARSARVSEPLTLKVVVDGDGDLDRVDLAGETSSEDWKAYPMNARTEDGAAGKPAHRKVFEQVLVPLREGVRTVPAAVARLLRSTRGTATRRTPPIRSRSRCRARLRAPATDQASAVPAASAAPASSCRRRGPVRRAPRRPRRSVTRTVLLSTAPAACSSSRSAPLLTWFWRRRAARARQREMRRRRRAARSFPSTGRPTISSKLASRRQWNVAPADVTADLDPRRRLGPVGDSLRRHADGGGGAALRARAGERGGSGAALLVARTLPERARCAEPARRCCHELDHRLARSDPRRPGVVSGCSRAMVVLLLGVGLTAHGILAAEQRAGARLSSRRGSARRSTRITRRRCSPSSGRAGSAPRASSVRAALTSAASGGSRRLAHACGPPAQRAGVVLPRHRLRLAGGARRRV